MILALGTVTLDTIDTPARNVVEVPGGSALYFAAAACSTASVRPLGVAGSDYPTAALDPLGMRGVDLGGLRTSNRKSLRWHARYDGEGGRTTLSSDRSILESFDPVLSAEEAATHWLFLGSIDPRIQRRVLDQVTAPMGVGLDSMSHWIDGHAGELKSLVARASVYFGSEEEVRVLGESDEVADAAQALLKQGPDLVVVKRGRLGATVITQDLTLTAPARPADAQDPTGAGDAFAAAFMATLVGDGGTSLPARGSQAQGTLEHALAAGVQAGAWATSAFSWEGLLR